MLTQELGHAIASGESWAWQSVYEDNYQAALRTATRAGASHADAEDAVHEAFTSLYTAIRRGVDLPSNFRPYLLTSVRNAALTMGRRSRRETVLGDAFPERPDDQPIAEELVQRRQENALVADTFADLPGMMRHALWLVDVMEKSYADGAASMDMSVTGFGSLLSRARRELRDRYVAQQFERGGRDGSEHASTVELVQFVDETLGKRKTAVVESHVALCPACALIVSELREEGVSVRAFPFPPLLGFLAQAGGNGRVFLARTASLVFLARRSATWLGIAAVGTAAVIGGALVFGGAAAPGASGVPYAAGHESTPSTAVPIPGGSASEVGASAEVLATPEPGSTTPAPGGVVPTLSDAGGVNPDVAAQPGPGEGPAATPGAVAPGGSAPTSNPTHSPTQAPQPTTAPSTAPTSQTPSPRPPSDVPLQYTVVWTSDAGDFPASGGEVTLEYVVVASVDGQARDVALEFSLWPGQLLVSAAGWTCSGPGRLVACEPRALAPGDRVTGSVTITVGAGDVRLPWVR